MGTSPPLDQEAQEAQTKGRGRTEGRKERCSQIATGSDRLGDAPSWLREQAFRATGQDIHSDDQYLHQTRHNSYLRDQAETVMVLNIFRQF
jgi:hypothetical protein